MYSRKQFSKFLEERKMVKRFCFSFAVFIFCASHAMAQHCPRFIPFRKNELWGYCDSTKKILLSVQYKRAFPFVNNRALVEMPGDAPALIDTTGKIVKPFDQLRMNDYITGMGMLRVSSRSNGQTGLLGIDGRLILEPQYDYVEVLGPDSFEVVRNEKKGVIDSNGKVLVKFIPFDGDAMPMPFMISNNECDKPCMWKPFSENMAVVVHKGKFGYCDTTKHITIPCKYAIAESFHYGLGRVTEILPGQKETEPYTDKDGVEHVSALKTGEGYVDSKGTEYWEDN